MSDMIDRWPPLTFAEAEAEVLQKHYAEAKVILEYGSGGSTVLAAQKPGKLIFSVESDRAWFTALQRKFDEAELPSLPIMYHADIGPTGAWGRPLDDRGWAGFYRYPLAIWAQPFFRQPDLVLVDGRLRAACFVATCLNTRKPVTILFDDYENRQSYKVVEALAQPNAIVGRMAVFHIMPREWPVWAPTLLAELCTQMSYVLPQKKYGPNQYSMMRSEVMSYVQRI
ncbi:hypothetical protein [Gemmobacter serpentinus]|uniref:hypothetical protein n=1 Tax=Gemmobacter serpentinus TaxID=2652247 RepID=UPI0018656D62|nr:hypothetical protein [Gemmobacter serpentinus]